MISSHKNSSNNFLVTLLATVVAAVASSLCCIGPLIYLLFGVSAAGLSGIEQLGWLQYPMLTLSSALMIYGFWRLYLSPKPLCSGIINRRNMLWLYWLSVPITLTFQLYPFVLPWILEIFE